MSLSWRLATSYADEMLARASSEDHEDHRLAPEFKAVGIHEAPCMNSYCKQRDEAHSEQFDRAESAHMDHGAGHPEDLDLSKPLHGFEVRADVDHIMRNAADPNLARKFRPTVFRSGGKHYIMDGHHALAGALLRGSATHPVHMIDLDTRGDK